MKLFSGTEENKTFTIIASDNKRWNVEVYAPSGKLYSKFILRKPVHKVQVQGWAQGLYRVAFKNGQHVAVQKLIIR